MQKTDLFAEKLIMGFDLTTICLLDESRQVAYAANIFTGKVPAALNVGFAELPWNCCPAMSQLTDVGAGADVSWKTTLEFTHTVSGPVKPVLVPLTEMVFEMVSLHPKSLVAFNLIK